MCSWSEGTFLIYTLTEEDSSNDVAFDLAPLDNVPPYSRQARCLSKDTRKFSSRAEESENVWVFWRYQSSPVHVCYCCWTNDAESERRAVFNQYKRLTLLRPKLQACFGNTERIQSKWRWKTFYSQAKTVFHVFRNTGTWGLSPDLALLCLLEEPRFSPYKARNMHWSTSASSRMSSIWSSTPVPWPGSWSAPLNFTPFCWLLKPRKV